MVRSIESQQFSLHLPDPRNGYFEGGEEWKSLQGQIDADE